MPTVPPAPITHKRCVICGEDVDVAQFRVKNPRTGTLRYACKPCEAKESTERYRRNPERHKASVYAWRAKNPDKARLMAAEWRKQNPERAKEVGRRADEKRRPQKAEWRKANTERIKAWAADYRKRRAEVIAEYGRVYYKANKASVDARIKKAIAANPELYKQLHKAAKHRRRERFERNGPHEKFSDLEIFERDAWTCGLCRRPVDPTLTHPDPMSASLDHVRPIAKGGGHTRDNTQCAHLRCNLSKRDRDGIAAA